MAKKKTAKKTAKKAVKTATLNTAKRALMVPVEDDLFNEFSLLRERRKENREFPWTVRDCMDTAIRDYIAKHGN